MYWRLTLIFEYEIFDCWLKRGKCPVRRGLYANLAVVMTEYVFRFLCLWFFLLKSLIYDFFGTECLLVSLYEQLGASETDGTLCLELGCWLEETIVTLIVGPVWGSGHYRELYNA